MLPVVLGRSGLVLSSAAWCGDVRFQCVNLSLSSAKTSNSEEAVGRDTDVRVNQVAEAAFALAERLLLVVLW